MAQIQKQLCPSCGEESFRHVPIGSDTSIDTIGTINICVTESGTFFHAFS